MYSIWVTPANIDSQYLSQIIVFKKTVEMLVIHLNYKFRIKALLKKYVKEKLGV